WLDKMGVFGICLLNLTKRLLGDEPEVWRIVQFRDVVRDLYVQWAEAREDFARLGLVRVSRNGRECFRTVLSLRFHVETTSWAILWHRLCRWRVLARNSLWLSHRRTAGRTEAGAIRDCLLALNRLLDDTEVFRRLSLVVGENRPGIV